MADSQQKKVFVPSRQRLLMSRLKFELLEIVAFALLGIIFVRPDVQLAAAFVLLLCIIKALQFLGYSKKVVEQSEIVISSQDIYGLPGMVWFNGFQSVEKISIPFDKIDKHKTGILRTRWGSGNLIWSTDGKNILLSYDFEKEQLREIAGLIGCPSE